MRRASFAWITLGIILAAFPSRAQTTAAPPPAPSPEQAAFFKSAEAFVRNLFAWGADFKVSLGPLSPSPSSDFYTVPIHVTFNGQTDAGEAFISKDGKTFVRGELYSMAADPFAENRAKIHLENNPSKGPADARITVVEFSDFQCPHCAELYRSLKSIEPKYPQIRVVFKDYPIVQIHPWAETAAIGARCAFMQSPDAFWKIHDSIFESQDLISAENVWEKLIGFARDAGLDADAFKGCMASPDARRAVEGNLADGQALGITSTPTVYVNGRTLVGGDKIGLVQFIEYEMQTLHIAPFTPAAKPSTPAAKR
ncbi:MAG: thioredoxin domain-containing protein [Candidatus Acidiferrales bacterium]